MSAPRRSKHHQNSDAHEEHENAHSKKSLSRRSSHHGAEEDEDPGHHPRKSHDHRKSASEHRKSRKLTHRPLEHSGSEATEHSHHNSEENLHHPNHPRKSRKSRKSLASHPHIIHPHLDIDHSHDDHNDHLKGPHPPQHARKSLAVGRKSFAASSHRKLSTAPIEPVSDRLRRSVEIFKELYTQYPNMKQTLESNDSLMSEFIAHPNLADEVSKNKFLAQKILKDPDGFQKMITRKSVTSISKASFLQPQSSSMSRISSHSVAGNESFSIPISQSPSVSTMASVPSTTPSHSNSIQGESLKLLQSSRNSHSHPESDSSHANDAQKKRQTVVTPYIDFVPDNSTIEMVKQCQYPFDSKIENDTPIAIIRHLAHTSYLHLHRHIEKEEPAVSCISQETGNYFEIMTQDGVKVYKAEDAPPACLNMGSCKGFQLILFAWEFPDDGVAIMRKVFSFSSKIKVEIFCPATRRIGFVTQKSEGSQMSTFTIHDSSNEEIIRVKTCKQVLEKKGKICDFEFVLTDDKKTLCSRVVASWVHNIDDDESSHENFAYEIKFPKQLNCHTKLLIITAWILIYKLYFEKSVMKQVRTRLQDKDSRKVKFDT